jgi:hypothetical protein
MQDSVPRLFGLQVEPIVLCIAVMHKLHLTITMKHSIGIAVAPSGSPVQQKADPHQVVATCVCMYIYENVLHKRYQRVITVKTLQQYSPGYWIKTCAPAGHSKHSILDKCITLSG